MTDTEITPELLRTVGNWLVQQPGSTDMAHVEIAEQADRLEREQEQQVADLLAPSRPIAEVSDGALLAYVRSLAEVAADHFEGSIARDLDDWAVRIERRVERNRAESTRIDRLAKAFHDAMSGQVDSGRSTWDLLTSEHREACRSGVGAVLDYLAEERSAAADSETCGKPETQQVTPRAREPRMWGDLCAVPPNVLTVVDKDGDRYLRDPWAKNGWTIERSCAPIDEYMSFEHAPFTEVIADA
ncbi:hypothetical protein QM787_03985 [Rhodococcus ruber]|uniref:Uncharacterized protein n=1 Tax=Rhodococcus ruber TaxID=1830 RepID=A0A098BU85_9NOCA|nr:hypothetical protein [Rhodococcus ruber]MCD2127661.1 hypothetical protein [Rhodococcus ruber]MCZ4504317.1 hypothetical protein [Rhodococcus ruber]MCZ4529447.1 hypothetical protein [Rhodococcus ruber]MCZ4620978.1 hypothetical protein [Rhodococcus ruber]MDI9967002.1 hypothetical protein [Rhodococcus ruber]